jgi:hypothetical protein
MISMSFLRQGPETWPAIRAVKPELPVMVLMREVGQCLVDQGFNMPEAHTSPYTPAAGQGLGPLGMVLMLALGSMTSARATAPDQPLQWPEPPEAEAKQDADPLPLAENPVWDYTLGGSFKSSDLAQFTRTAGLEPVLGLRYGRWKLGIGDGTEWLRFNSFRKDSSLDYRWLDTRRYSLSLSLQLHTLTGGEGSDAPESGPRTVRGRAIGNMAITRRWQAGLAYTQDLLGKGDSSTLGLGISYVWPLDPRSEMVLNAGLTWGTAGHWRNTYGPRRWGADTLRTGIDSWGLGLSYKHRLARHWAWFGSLSFSGDLGPLAQLPGRHSGRSGQVGLLYFHR